MPYCHGFVVARFEDVIKDSGAVIQAINTHFNTSFDLFEHNDENVKECMKRVERMDMGWGGREFVIETGVARPSEIRKQEKAALEDTLTQNEELKKLLAQCNDVYEEFLGMTSGKN
jgi:hypothetical protein